MFTLAAVAGSVLAAPLATRVAAHRLRRWFAYLVLAIAAFVVIQALLDHAGGDEPRDREPTVVHTGHNRRTTREVRIMLGGGMGAGFGVDGAGSGC